MTTHFVLKTRLLVADGWMRLVRARVWLVLQCFGLALLIGLGLLWTRIPEKNAGQVMLTFLVPVMIAAGILWLQASTIRSLLRSLENKSPGTPLLFGACTLILWIVIGILLWGLIDRFDSHIESWAGYLNSRFDPHSRSHFATYEHFSSWLNKVSWLLHWVIVPGILLPLGCTAAFRMRRLPWKCILRVWIEWRWWPMILILALIGQAWPGTFFDSLPHGTVHGQVWRVVLKIAAAYFLAVLSWLLALVWSSVLLSEHLPEGGGPEHVRDSALRAP